MQEGEYSVFLVHHTSHDLSLNLSDNSTNPAPPVLMIYIQPPIKSVSWTSFSANCSRFNSMHNAFYLLQWSLPLMDSLRRAEDNFFIISLMKKQKFSQTPCIPRSHIHIPTTTVDSAKWPIPTFPTLSTGWLIGYRRLSAMERIFPP